MKKGLVIADAGAQKAYTGIGIKKELL